MWAHNEPKQESLVDSVTAVGVASLDRPQKLKKKKMTGWIEKERGHWTRKK